MKNLTQLWIETIEKDYPHISQNNTILSIIDEYFHAHFNPFTSETKILVECGDTKSYASPQIIKKLQNVTQVYYQKLFSKMIKIVLELFTMATQKDIIPELIVLPKWITYDFKPQIRKLYGVNVRYHDEYITNKNTIRIEAPKFAFLIEKSVDNT